MNEITAADRFSVPVAMGSLAMFFVCYNHLAQIFSEYGGRVFFPSVTRTNGFADFSPSKLVHFCPVSFFCSLPPFSVISSL